MDYPKTMKALVSYDKNNYNLEKQYPTPNCGSDDIIIKTEACGVCAGDLKCRDGADLVFNTSKTNVVQEILDITEGMVAISILKRQGVPLVLFKV